MQKFRVGDRISTPIGNLGTILDPPWEMPLHSLVQIDGGAKIWILNEILKPSDIPKIRTQGAKKCRKRNKK